MKLPVQYTELMGRTLLPLLFALGGVLLSVAGWHIIGNVRLGPGSGLAAVACGSFLVLLMPSEPPGRAAAAILGGCALAVPLGVRADALTRALLGCLAAFPFIIAAALASTVGGSTFSSRIAFISTWCGTQQIRKITGGLDLPGLVTLVFSTIALGGALHCLAAGTHSSHFLQWGAAGAATMAFAEMASSSHQVFSRGIGLAIPPFFRSPILARSLAEFWSRRWNLPASALFYYSCFRPFAGHGKRASLLVPFGGSAVAHFLLAHLALGEVWVSVACGGFFLVQPFLILAEKRLGLRTWPRWAARTWTLGALAIFSPLFTETAIRVLDPVIDSSLQSTAVATGTALLFVIVLAGFVAGTTWLVCRGDAHVSAAEQPQRAPTDLSVAH